MRAERIKKMIQYEIYEVPNEVLDGDEIFVTECHRDSISKEDTLELISHLRKENN